MLFFLERFTNKNNLFAFFKPAEPFSYVFSVKVFHLVLSPFSSYVGWPNAILENI